MVDRPSTIPPPPPEKPVGEYLNIKKMQELLKRHGYVLTAVGPRRISFFPLDAPRNNDGLVLDEHWRHLTPAEFRAFAEELKANEPPEEKP